jgi:RecB family endonuclease NucS
MEENVLVCPGCGTKYTNYKEYFACWTSHLEKKFTGKDNKIAPFDHSEAVKYYAEYPDNIEPGLRVFASEIGIFHGRIDLLGVDKDKNMVIIDVTMGPNWMRKADQLRKYRKNLTWMGKTIFGLKELPKIRLLIVRPNEYVKEIGEKK